MLHHSVMKDGAIQILPVARTTIPAGGDFEFKPSGYPDRCPGAAGQKCRSRVSGQCSGTSDDSMYRA